MTDDRMALIEALQKADDGNFLRSLAETVLQILMEADVEGLIGAARHERTDSRTGQRNGSRPRTLTTTTYDLLRGIRRGTGGRAYQELQAALQRLETTSIRTSVRAPKRRTEAQFGWLDGWTLEVDPETDQPRGMTITLSNWVYEGIVRERSLLPCTRITSC